MNQSRVREFLGLGASLVFAGAVSFLVTWYAVGQGWIPV